MNSLIKTAVCSAIAAMFLAACGGGGGGSADAGNSGSGSGSGTGGPVTPPVSALQAMIIAGEPGGSATLDGQGDMARFSSVNGLATDSKGNIYVSENAAIRKITPDGSVTTYTGQQISLSSKDGQISEALFVQPSGLVVDREDNLYVLDADRVRKITPSGVVSTIVILNADDSRNWRSELLIDSQKNLYFIDVSGVGITQVAQDGKIKKLNASTLVQAGAIGYLTSGITSIAIDNQDQIYAFIQNQYMVLKIATDKTVSAYLTTFSNSGPNNQSLMGVSDRIVYHPKEGLLGYRDIGIYKPDPVSGYSLFAGGKGASVSTDGQRLGAELQNVQLLTVAPNGDFVMFDAAAVRKITADGNVKTIAGKNALAPAPSTADGRFHQISGITEGPGQSLYLADYASVRQLNLNDKSLKTIAGKAVTGYLNANGTNALFRQFLKLSTDSAGNVLVADTGNNYLRKIDSQGNVSTVAGSGPDRSYSSNKTFNILDIKKGINNTLYINDNAKTLRQLQADNTFTRLAGNPDVSDISDGDLNKGGFGRVRDMVQDSKGNIFVIDRLTNLIRRVSKDGDISHFTGITDKFTQLDGTLKEANFVCPRGITVDPQDNLYVTDACTNAIRKISADGKVSTLNIQWAEPNGKLYRTIPFPQEILWMNGKLYVHAEGLQSVRYVTGGAIFQIPLN